MLSRSSVACCSCFWDRLITSAASEKLWHTPSSVFPCSSLLVLPPSVTLRLQFKADVMLCSWAKSLPVEASSEENCFMKASRASEITQEQIKAALSPSQFTTFSFFFPQYISGSGAKHFYGTFFGSQFHSILNVVLIKPATTACPSLPFASPSSVKYTPSVQKCTAGNWVHVLKSEGGGLLLSRPLPS